MGKENLVDIMCIGVQKGSTSWLHHVINSHPKIQAFKRNPKTSTNKEAHFWDWNYNEGIEWYKNLMAVDENKLSLDFSPEYAFIGEEKIKLCKNLSPSAKIFYVLREPVCRAISAIRMFVMRDKGENAEYKLEYNKYFKEAIQKSKIIPHSEYYKNYQRWNKYYKNIHIINYEEIVKNPTATVANLFKYLNLDIEDFNAQEKKEFNVRMKKTVWKSTEFEFSKECLFFLDGMLDRNRKYFEKFFEIEFKEHHEFGLI